MSNASVAKGTLCHVMGDYGRELQFTILLNGAAYPDLQDYTIKVQVHDDDTDLLDLTAAHVDDPNGIAGYTLTQAQSDGLAAGEYAFRIVLEKTDYRHTHTKGIYLVIEK